MTQHLVLVPGLLCDQTIWSAQASVLKQSVQIQVADHGRLASLTGMATEILANAPAQFALAGHSMGGRVALEMMRLAPARVSKLALLDTGYKPLAEGAAGEQERAGRFALLELAERKGMRVMAQQWVQSMVHPSRLKDEPLIESVLAMFERKTSTVYAAQIQALLSRPDATTVLSTIHCPTLVLCGADDAWSTLPQHREIASAIAGSSLVSIPNCGHMSTMERPEEVTRAMAAWLKLID